MQLKFSWFCVIMARPVCADSSGRYDQKLIDLSIEIVMTRDVDEHLRLAETHLPEQRIVEAISLLKIYLALVSELLCLDCWIFHYIVRELRQRWRCAALALRCAGAGALAWRPGLAPWPGALAPWPGALAPWPGALAPWPGLAPWRPGLAWHPGLAPWR